MSAAAMRDLLVVSKRWKLKKDQNTKKKKTRRERTESVCNCSTSSTPIRRCLWHLPSPKKERSGRLLSANKNIPRFLPSATSNGFGRNGQPCKCNCLTL